MKRMLFVAVLTALLIVPCLATAALLPEHSRIAVMDLGGRKGFTTNDVNARNLEKAATDYVIEALTDSGRFDVIDKVLVEDFLAAERISTVGIIDPERAQRIGNALGVRYIVYGNVDGVGADTGGVNVVGSGVEVHNARAVLIIRVMDVASGDIITMAKGTGKSKSSKVSGGTEALGFVTVGTKKISQAAVHNAIKKAAYDAADKIVGDLYGTAKG